MALLFLYVRGNIVEEKAMVRRYFSNRTGMTIAVMISSITPFAWFLYRVVSKPSLPDSIGRELLVLSVPLLVLMFIFDRWLYLRNKGIRIPRFMKDTHPTHK